MDQENKINKNHSLGRLYPAKKTKPRSPDCTGKLHLKRDHLLILLKQLEQSQGDEYRLQHCWLEGQRSAWSVHDDRDFSEI
jgi:hypothetical protein